MARVPIDPPVKAPGSTIEERRGNNTGLPDELKAEIEGLSGMALDDVKVHYHSPIPARMQARAFTQGNDIHVGPGEEKHLAHEAWHVVQQKQGRVNTPLHVKGPVITDNEELEREADAMGARAQHSPSALPRARYHASTLLAPALTGIPGTAPIQPKWILRDGEEVEVDDDYELQEGEEDIPDPDIQSSSKGVGKGTQLRLIGHAEKSKGEPKLALPTVFEEVGTKALQSSGKLNTKDYRTNTSQYNPGWGGSGWDETFRTSLVAKKAPKVSDQDREKFVKMVSSQREQTKDLLWRTEKNTTSKSKKKKKKEVLPPLAGHPGALSKDVTDFSKGITSEHNSKDTLRSKWTEHQFEQGEATDFGQKTGEALLMSDLMTSELMSQPYAQLSQVTPDTSTLQAYNPVHGGMYDLSAGTLSREGEKATSDVHYAREHRKWRDAEKLYRHGYHNLYPPVMKDYLEKEGGWSGGFEAFSREQREQGIFTDKGPPKSQAYIPTTDDTPMTLKEWNDTLGGSNPPAQLARAVSDPRALVQDEPPSAPSTSSKKRQRTLNEFFTPVPKKKKDDD